MMSALKQKSNALSTSLDANSWYENTSHCRYKKLCLFDCLAFKKVKIVSGTVS